MTLIHELLKPRPIPDVYFDVKLDGDRATVSMSQVNVDHSTGKTSTTRITYMCRVLDHRDGESMKLRLSPVDDEIGTYMKEEIL